MEAGTSQGGKDGLSRTQAASRCPSPRPQLPASDCPPLSLCFSVSAMDMSYSMGLLYFSFTLWVQGCVNAQVQGHRTTLAVVVF